MGFTPKPAMYHMLKSLGINPDELDASVKGISQFAGSLDQRLSAIERKIDLILLHVVPACNETAMTIISPEDAGLIVTATKE